MPYEARGKCVYKKDGGAKVGCTKGSVKKYLAALHANADESVQLESTKDLIKRLLNERIGLFVQHETHNETNFDILMGQKPIGSVRLAKAKPNFGKDTIELVDIVMAKDVNHLALGGQTIETIFKKYPDVNRILVQPKVASRDFWSKLQAQRLDSKYMIIFRGH